MYRSLLHVTQDFKLWVLCFDELTYKLLSKMNLKNVELISLENFEDEDLRRAKENRSLVEYFWTCTPSLPLYILSKHPDLNMITYIDADLYFYSDPSTIFEEFNASSILLIEHRYAEDVESKIKNNGLYNVQFITFRNDEAGITALRWWRDRCIEWCYRRSEDGKMGDQKYLDDWTTRFRNICVLKNKGAGLAPWNIIKYKIKQVENETYVDEDKLIFYHFHFFSIYSNKLFNLTIYNIYRDHKKIIYIPYIKNLGETICFVKGFDNSFNKGYSSFRFGSIKDALWTLRSLLRGNFLWSYALSEQLNTTKRKSILCIVPLSPPVTGSSFSSETIVNYLKRRHDVVVMAYQRGNLISGKFSLKQFLRIIAIGLRLMLMKKYYHSVYLVISSTFWGNLRDLFFLFAIGHDLRSKTVIHLHGANIDRYLSGALPWIKYLNRKMLGSVKHAIVLGNTFSNIFNGYISSDKIRIVKNYFNPSLLISDENISEKFNSPEKINILFLSNLIKEKGYKVLLDAFLSLPKNIRNKAMLHFAGEIYSVHDKKIFLDEIKAYSNIVYHGPVAGEEKKKLLKDSHIFCLPTFYKFEGQPISMLEAYASGCIVLTTPKGGIRDIFVNNTNGFYIDIGLGLGLGLDLDLDLLKGKLREKLEMLITDIDKHKDIAIYNRKEASEKYTEEVFCKKLEGIILNSGGEGVGA